MADKITAARAFVRVLKAEGVDTIFVLTGGHILGFMDAAVQEGIRLVDVRHEEAAAHAADAYARLTGRVGVAAVTAGPGATNAVTGVAAAWHAASPIVLIVGRHPEHEDLRGGLQEMEHAPLFSGISKWTYTARDPERYGHVAVTALRHASAGRGGPVVVDFPILSQLQEVPESTVPDPAGTRPDRGAAVDPETARQVADLLAGAERPVVFGGTGLRWARRTPDLEALAEAGRIPVFVNSLARGAMRWDHPLLGNRARSFALGGADLVVALGVDWDFRTKFGGVVASDATVVHVDAEPTRIGWNRPVDVGVAADPGVFVGQVLAHADRFARDDDTEWVRTVRDEEDRKHAAADEASRAGGSPVPPERFAREVAEFFGDDSIVAADGGDIVSTTAKWLRTSAFAHLLDPGPFGCLGVGAPFALAAKALHPDRTVGIVYGDGAFGFNGMEFDTMVRHDLPVIGVVGNDGAWNNIKALHRAMYPDRVVASDLGYRPYHAMVEALGGHGELVTDADDLRPALERAAESGKPALVNVHIAEQMRMSSVYGF
ncbi:MAG: thiamine pyrophosphate-binding protein [Acidimicrobiia bacterium]|nr:thiamine pyrophosphate-binding protein [Acidimicrobiia bacterium]